MLILSDASYTADDLAIPDHRRSKEYSVVSIDGRFAAYIGSTPIILTAKLRDKKPKTYIEAIEAFGPAFIFRDSSSGVWEWHFDDGMVYGVAPKWHGELTSPISLKLQKSGLMVIRSQGSKAVQGDSRQDATRPDTAQPPK